MPLLFPFKVQTGSNIVCRVRFTRVGDVPYYMCNLDTAAEQAAGASMIHRVQLSPDLVQAFEVRFLPLVECPEAHDRWEDSITRMQTK